MANEASFSITNALSTKTSLTFPAKVALASPVPISAATSRTLTGCENSRWLPSGSVITGTLEPIVVAVKSIIRLVLDNW